MKKIIVFSFMLMILLSAPAQADLYYDMGQKVNIYNANVDSVPDLVKDLLGNEEIYGIIKMEDGSTLEVKAVTSNAVLVEFSKVSIEIEAGKGDHNSDGKLTALDALSAIKMSVGKIPVDLALDVDGSGSVTAIDARLILQSSVGLSSEVNPTILLKADEETLRNLMVSSEPANDFLDAYKSGAIEIEPVGFGNKVKFSIGKIVLKITNALGLV